MSQTLRILTASTPATPSALTTYALDVELIDALTIGRVHGSKDNDYAAGVICATMACCAEREHHPDRLPHPCATWAKGSGQFERISWDDKLDFVADEFVKAEQRCGAESACPYYYAGAMSLVTRDGIHCLRQVKISRLPFHHLRQSGLCRRRQSCGRIRSARDGGVRAGGNLGHQSGQRPNRLIIRLSRRASKPCEKESAMV